MELRALTSSLSSPSPSTSQRSPISQIKDLHAQGLRLRRAIPSKNRKAAAQHAAQNRKPSVWRMQVADPLDNFRDSFGNECTVERRARQMLEMTDGYKSVAQQVDYAQAEMEALIAAEKYELACELRDRLSTLQLQKRLLEISAKPRILYRIGDLIVHKRYGYRGVIYGHDPECSAPREWKDAMKVDFLADGPNQPFYHVLVDTRDRPGGMSTYVAQENLVMQEEPTPVLHPWVPKFFVGFQEDTYVPGQRLRQVYPNDW